MPATQKGRSLVLRWMLPSSVSSGSHTCEPPMRAIEYNHVAYNAMQYVVDEVVTA